MRTVLHFWLYYNLVLIAIVLLIYGLSRLNRWAVRQERRRETDNSNRVSEEREQ